MAVFDPFMTPFMQTEPATQTLLQRIAGKIKKVFRRHEKKEVTLAITCVGTLINPLEENLALEGVLLVAKPSITVPISGSKNYDLLMELLDDAEDDDFKEDEMMQYAYERIRNILRKKGLLK